MGNVRLVLEYDGTAYAGFQIQSGRPTVQEAVERAIHNLTGEDVRIIGAGRTDAGVHATGQVVNFHTSTHHGPSTIMRALNALLPEDIAVVDADEVPPDFHARFSARSREYRYTILNRRAPSPLRRHTALHVPQPLDVEAMQGACTYLIGTHDFASFGGAMRAEGTTVRTVYRAECWRSGDLVLIEMEANAYLSRMVRSIVGTLLKVGLGRWRPDDVAAVLTAAYRQRSAPVAPAHGLCLTRVNY